jgi:molybdenum cofactor synthesis domain-containing protein
VRVSKIRTEEAVGQVLPHDLTRIVPGKFKGAAFKKGHCLVPEDIPELLRMGKDSIYVLELEPDEIHEDEAGTRLGRAAAGAGVTCSDPQESRANLFASRSGLLKINVAALEEINDLPSVVLSTLPNNTPVAAGDLLAGTKVIPLAVKKEVVQAVEQIAAKLGGVVSVIEYRALDVGIIVTGNEVFHKRIKDRFGPVLRDKVSSFGSRVLDFQYAPDDPERIAELIDGMIAAGAQLLLVSGGMSVDPDDVTPQGISLSGARIEIYGAPVLPGAMFMLAYQGEVPIIGVPACGMYFHTTILDLVLPRLLTGERLTRRDIVSMGHGGLCRTCPECRFPRCSFGSVSNVF